MTCAALLLLANDRGSPTVSQFPCPEQAVRFIKGVLDFLRVRRGDSPSLVDAGRGRTANRAGQVVLDHGADRGNELLRGGVPHGRDPQHVPAEEEPAHLRTYQRCAQGTVVIRDHAP